jgi:hypothetical protein
MANTVQVSSENLVEILDAIYYINEAMKIAESYDPKAFELLSQAKESLVDYLISQVVKMSEILQYQRNLEYLVKLLRVYFQLDEILSFAMEELGDDEIAVEISAVKDRVRKDEGEVINAVMENAVKDRVRKVIKRMIS